MKYYLAIIPLAFCALTACGNETIESHSHVGEADWTLDSEPAESPDINRVLARDASDDWSRPYVAVINGLDDAIPSRLATDLGAPQSRRLDDVLREDSAPTASINPGYVTVEPDDRETSIEPALTDSNDGFGANSDCLALAFGGSTLGVIENSAAMNLSFARGTTIEGWVRIDDRTGTLIAKRGHELNPSWAVDYADGELRFSVASDASHRSVYAAEFPASEWFHFAIIRGPTVEGNVAIFIDGVENSTRVENGGKLGDIINDEPVVIGFDTAQKNVSFRGAIASLHISNGVGYSDAFDPQDRIESTDNTIGLWDFTHVSDNAVDNLEDTNYGVRLAGPIYGEHSGLCD
jgi:hypothetical protein